MENEDDCCLVCLEELTELFIPCDCKFPICQFCWNQILNEDGRCPNCRRAYEADRYKIEPLPKKPKVELERMKLQNVRVLQKNLVYVSGFTGQVTESLLQSQQYFGQFGDIHKIVMNSKLGQVPTLPNDSIGVYITFENEVSANSAIEAVDGSVWQGQRLRARHGTTKYCIHFLKGQPCQNADCMYLHVLSEDHLTKEDLAQLSTTQTKKYSAHKIFGPQAADLSYLLRTFGDKIEEYRLNPPKLHFSNVGQLPPRQPVVTTQLSSLSLCQRWINMNAELYHDPKKFDPYKLTNK
eukprot:NODE_258_length_12622_cov_0.213767.p3 type:complete len:295 gc:universal NODE_258_length_12622_cov_0.213767:12444-11560(-)